MTETRLAHGTPFADTALYRFLHDYGHADLGALHACAREEPVRFWAEVEDAVGLRWTRRYRTVCDLSAGPMWPRWFVDGELDLFDNLVGRIAHEDPARPALVWEGDDGATRRFSYAELDREARRLAAAFERLGVAPGARIAMYLPMVPETAVVFLAAARLGAIVLPLFSGYGADAVANRLADSGAAVMVCADGYLRRGRRVDMLAEARAAATAAGLAHLLVVPRLGTFAAPTPGGGWREWDYGVLLAACEPAGGAAPHPADAPLLILYTSGTTGRPKGVVHTHAGFPLKAAQDMLMAFDLGPGDRLMWITDMGWMMGPWLVFGGLLRGATLVFFEGTPDHPAPDRIWQLAARHRLTHLGLSPTLVRLLMAAGEAGLPRPGLPESLRVFGSTGEPWNDAPWHWLFDTVGQGRCPIINYSGGTEIGGGILACFAGLPQKPCGFHGPIPGMQADVVDTAGRSLPGGGGTDEVGELVLRAPWPGMAHGFWQDDARYLETYWARFPGLWMHGDWARVDGDGHWFIQGRSDDTLKIAGKRVGPAEYESALVAHPLVAEAVAIGVPDPVKGEVATCFVTIAPSARGAAQDWTALEAELVAHVAAQLGKPLAPARVHRVGALPRTRNGKILRRVVRAVWLGKETGDLGSLENPEALDALRRCREAFAAMA
ncbi:AMP-binding protein [Pseudothauera rhizosphaerae]|uniref:acetate--CoA ligase n=1 Tax=Pseudothauera rhizosphaerae TaxID=2565932 RepID=A0A4S4AP52_9RHOO|nr:AMP-binding protein [Pseudothauera rhizosphaerae]THF60199.1 AMP-dependent synthetase [Pseudothauera rhizosphaerae]